MKIALVQLHISKSRKENLDRGAEAFCCAAEAGASLVVFPELSFTPFYPKVPATPESPARKFFLQDRRPDFYRTFGLLDFDSKPGRNQKIDNK